MALQRGSRRGSLRRGCDEELPRRGSHPATASRESLQAKFGGGHQAQDTHAFASPSHGVIGKRGNRRPYEAVAVPRMPGWVLCGSRRSSTPGAISIVSLSLIYRVVVKAAEGSLCLARISLQVPSCSGSKLNLEGQMPSTSNGRTTCLNLICCRGHAELKAAAWKAGRARC